MNSPLPLTDSINLRHLRAALEIRRLGSISRAADRVHLSQSAITQGLAKLEANLGLPLFSRSATGLFATAEGEVFLRRGERAMKSLAKIDQLLAPRTAQGPRQLHRLITTTQLKALTSVVEHGSYTLAANQLKLTQPTVHRAVKELETLCQQTLFQRSPTGVEPSWQARQAARHAGLFFAELEQGIDETGEQRGLTAGSLRVGSLPLARTRLVPHAVIQLLESFPDARVNIIDGPYEEQLHGLLHGQLDLIIGALRTPAPSPDIDQELLFSDPLHVVVRPGHPLAQRAAANIEELDVEALGNLDWIAPRQNTPAREVFSRFFADKGVAPPKRIIECSSLVAIRSLLLDSDRAALLPARQVELEVRMGILSVSPQSLPGTSRDIGIARRKDWEPTRLQRHFLELLRNSESFALG